MRYSFLTCLWIFCALIYLVSLPAHAQQSTLIIETPAGSFKGLHHAKAGVNEFRGILYATAQRFDLPVKVPTTAVIRDATQFGPNCPQVVRFGITEMSLDEQCLFLNVTTPESAKSGDKLPVLVWIHGGGMGGGSNLYRLDRLATEGKMVVVSLNYRLGIFGFMPHPALDADFNGNLGLTDQRAALTWVKENIAAFGGDPNNVTLGGESAGSGLICQHLVSPEVAGGLFHKAILISGACSHPLPTLQEALDNPIWPSVSYNPNDPERIFRCPVPGEPDYSDQASLLCMKKQSVQALLQAQTFEAGDRLLSFAPVTGNKTVPRSFHEAAKTGNIMKVPMIIGGATDEFRLYVAYDVLGDNAAQKKHPVTLDQVTSHYLPKYYGTDVHANEMILKRYFGSTKNPVNLDGATLGSMLSSFNPQVGMNNCDYLKTANILNSIAEMPAIYQFEFSDPNALVHGVSLAPGKDPGFELGAVHSAILNYLFPNYSNTAAMNAPPLSDASNRLASQIISYISNFLRDDSGFVGSPPQWRAYDGSITTPASDNVLIFKPDNIALYNAYGGLTPESMNGHQCAFWSALYPR